jgi:hypothetical protein
VEIAVITKENRNVPNVDIPVENCEGFLGRKKISTIVAE